MTIKEWRVYVKGFQSGQGHYIIAPTKLDAIRKDKRMYSHRRNQDLGATLWKTGKDRYSLKRVNNLSKKPTLTIADRQLNKKLRKETFRVMDAIRF